MDRNDLTLAIAGALIAAFLLGWVLRWAFARLNAAGPRNAARTADLAARLHAAEDGQARSERRLAEVEAEASRRVLELQGEVDDARGRRSPGPRSQAEEVRAAYRRTTWSGAENRPRRRRPEAGSTRPARLRRRPRFATRGRRHAPLRSGRRRQPRDDPTFVARLVPRLVPQERTQQPIAEAGPARRGSAHVDRVRARSPVDNGPARMRHGFQPLGPPQRSRATANPRIPFVRKI